MIDKDKLLDHIQRKMQQLREEKSEARRNGDKEMREVISAAYEAYRVMELKITRGDFDKEDTTHET